MKPFSKSDWVFAAVIAVAAVFVWIAILFLPMGKGESVVVRLGGEVVATLPLDEDAVYDTGGNAVTIHSGEVFISEADCPGRQCMRSGTIRTSGGVLVCAPNKLSVTIEGKGVGVDAITG